MTQLTPEQRIERFQALVNAAIKYTGVNLKPVIKPRMLGDVLQAEVELAFVLVKDWQPPQSEPINYPEDTDHENPIPVSANGHAADIQRDGTD